MSVDIIKGSRVEYQFNEDLTLDLMTLWSWSHYWSPDEGGIGTYELGSVSPSVCQSVRQSSTFLRIGSLLFSDFFYEVRGP